MKEYHLTVISGAQDWELNDLISQALGVVRVTVRGGKAHLNLATLAEWSSNSHGVLYSEPGGYFTVLMEGVAVAEIHPIR